MKWWRVWYYKYPDYVTWKQVRADNAEQAILRARVKNVIQIKEMGE